MGQSKLVTDRREAKFQALSNLVPSACGLAEKIYQRSKFTAANDKEAALKVLAEFDAMLPDHPVLVATRERIESGETIERIAASPQVGGG